jgi:uncharacterized protein YycO
VLILLIPKNDRAAASDREQFMERTVVELDRAARTGDLIFRRVEGGGGTFVLMTDSTSAFSHVGIVWKPGDETYVIHVVPAANSSESYVEIIPSKDYVQPASAVALYRLRNDENRYAQKAAEIAYQWVGNVSFDMDFDLVTDDRQYCTELVWKTYKKTGVDLIDGYYDTVHFAFLKTNKVILVSNLLNSRWLKQVYSQHQQRE